jgi:hypothetical protein
MDKLCNKIKLLLKRYIYPPKYYKTDKLATHILYMIRTIENLHIRSMFPVESGIKHYFPSLIETLFTKEEIEKKYCTAQIVYLYHKNRNYIFPGDWGKIVLDHTDDQISTWKGAKINPSKLHRFVEKFLAQIEDCTFTNILLNIQDPKGSHANLLMINKDSEGIILSLYDPHGYTGEGASDVFLDLFASALAQKYKGQVVVKNRINISCIKGLQTFSSDRKGYCSIFSLLWIYIIIKLQKTLDEDEKRLLFENLVTIENCIIGFYSPEQLYNIVLVFASKVMLYYVKKILKPDTVPIFYKEYIKQRKNDDSWGFKVDLSI